ncbi:MAG: reverse transcriptase domain-containing protein [Chloroflexota bacterium]
MTLLRQTLHPANLRRAWNDVATNGGVAGVDEITIPVWRRSWEARLVALADAVRHSRYRPQPLRRRRIPKTTPGEWRTLHIPTVTDRVLQRAILQQLQPLFEPRFLDCSYGYRPGRGVHDAVRQINRLRRQGFVYVLDADIDDFFNQVDQPLLLEMLTASLPDQSLLPLIRQLLQQARPAPNRAKGIPMGSPLSPLLANVLLHRFDQAIVPRYPLIRYADDFIILARSDDAIEDAFRLMERSLAQLKLQIEPRKTEITSFAAGFDFLGVHFAETWYWYRLNEQRIEIHDGQEDPHIAHYDPNY